MRASNIFLTVDILVLMHTSTADFLLLIQRKNPPFKDLWALPGGFVDQDEDLPDAAKRELLEETGVVAENLTQVGAFGKPGRDPRQHTVSVAFMTYVTERTEAIAGDDAADAKWYPVTELPILAFDHAEIINIALNKK